MKEKLPLLDLNSSADDTDASNGKAGFNENLLRPKWLKDYIGQKAVAAKLEVFIRAAKQRSQVLDHVLLSGPPGLGKTTLAHIVANEMGGRLHLAAGPTLERSADLLSILSELKDGDVLFIDEIHRLNPAVEESLYPAMEDFQVQLIVGEGPAAQSITLNLERFTLIGATTQPGKLTGPLRDRFGINLNLDFYDQAEMSEILSRSAGILDIALDSKEIEAVAMRSRGTPRIGNRLICRVRDFVEVLGNDPKQSDLSERARGVLKQAGDVNPNSNSGAKSASAQAAVRPAKSPAKGVELVNWALEFLEVDARGLQSLDRQYLKVLINHFKGGPAGVEAIAASLSEDRSTLEETIEPYLLKVGFIVRTARGRVATDLAYSHLGLEAKARSRVSAETLAAELTITQQTLLIEVD